MAEPTKLLQVTDFFTGLFCCLAVRDVEAVSRERCRLDRALGAVMPFLVTTAQRYGLTVRWQVRAHPIDGNSPIVQVEARRARDRGLVRLDGQRVRVALDGIAAERLLPTLPGGRQLYEEVTSEFLREYAVTL